MHAMRGSGQSLLEPVPILGGRRDGSAFIGAVGAEDGRAEAAMSESGITAAGCHIRDRRDTRARAALLGAAPGTARSSCAPHRCRDSGSSRGRRLLGSGSIPPCGRGPQCGARNQFFRIDRAARRAVGYAICPSPSTMRARLLEGLDQPFDVGAHPVDAVGAGVQGGQRKPHGRPAPPPPGAPLSWKAMEIGIRGPVFRHDVLGRSSARSEVAHCSSRRWSHLASRGMALRKPPPSRAATSMLSSPAAISCRTRIEQFVGVGQSLVDVHAGVSATAPFDFHHDPVLFRYRDWRVHPRNDRSTPPAQPMPISRSSSVSRLSRISSPVSQFCCSSRAPVMPVSSSMVKRNSSGVWTGGGLHHGEHRGDSEAVVSTEGGPFRLDPIALDEHADALRIKSKAVSLFFWWTMSTWLCRITVLRSSMPGVAGLRTSTFPQGRNRPPGQRLGRAR